MKYIQFYQLPVPGYCPDIIEGNGDRSVVILDGRNSKETWQAIAELECKKRGYIAWAIFSGESFSRSKRISDIVNI